MKEQKESIYPKRKRNAIVLAATWRSGSSFTSDILSSHPGVFFHYEPLLPYGVRTFYEENSFTKYAQKLILSLLKCRFIERYRRDVKRGDLTLKRNEKLAEFCWRKRILNKTTCYEGDNVEASCKSFKWTGMKLLRLGIKFLRPLLENDSMNIYVILLVRDPRAIMNSRKTSVTFCKKEFCSDVKILCSNMRDDLMAYNELSKLFPRRIILVRYEDLCLDPFGVVENIFKTIHLTFHSKVKNFLQKHTVLTINNKASTFRKSKTQILKWTYEINMTLLSEVQISCSSIMEQLGYKLVSSLTNLSISDVLSGISVM